MTAPDARAELIADLRAFADLLERRPDLPINEYPWMKYQYSPQGDEADRLAAVSRVAAVLGVEAEVGPAGEVTARLQLGCVEYVAYASTADSRARYDAERSYAGAVEPDLAVAR